MFIFYLFAVLSLVIGGIAWYRSDKIVWWEWLTGAAVGLLLAIIFHLSAFYGMTDDIETLSGQVTEVRFRPAWLETYQQRHTRKVGKVTTTYYTTEYQNHPDRWTATDSLGETADISRDFYDTVVMRFGGPIEKVRGDRTTWKTGSRMVSGDPLDYLGTNVKGYVEPVNVWHHWTNRVKATPSAFSFSRLTTLEEADVFPYPENSDRFNSERVLGTAQKAMPGYLWDQFNAVIGPQKHVNVILIGFGNQDSSIAEVQRARWIGGKKNDLVICYGGEAPKPSWVKVFGWTEAEEVKYNIQTIIQQQGVSPKVLPALRAEIQARYEPKDWSKFDYLTIEPPLWSYFVYLLVVGIVQSGMWVYFTLNENTKTPKRRNRYWN